MIEDKDTGKFFKDALEGYESPFDPNKMFDAIEDELPKKKASKRRAGFWIFGCAGLMGLMAISVLWLFLSSGENVISDSSIKPSLQQSNADFLHTKDSSTFKTRTSVKDNPSVKIKNENSKIESSRIEIKKSQTTKLQKQITNAVDTNSMDVRSSYSGWRLEDNQQSTISLNKTDQLKLLNLKDKESSKSVRNHLQPIQLLERFESRLERFSNVFLKNPFLISPFQNVQSQKRKWEIGLTSSYLFTSKRLAYSNAQSIDWFDNYLHSEKLHLAYDLGLNISYHLDNNWYFKGSLSYLHAQESHSFTTENAESIFDNDLINTIYVDRDNNPIDTLFGVNKIETTTQKHYLVTNLKLIGIGIGIGRSFALNPRLILATDFNIMPYLIQRSSGNIVDPQGILIDQADFVLDGQPINLNNPVLGTQFNLALKYKLNSRLHIGFSGSVRYHLGDFSNSSFLTINRNYLGGGLDIGVRF